MSWSYPNGRRVEPWGKASGRITYDPDGNVVAVLMHERRNQADGRAGDPETTSSYSAYFGRYDVDQGEGIIRRQVTGSLNADASGELTRHSHLMATYWFSVSPPCTIISASPDDLSGSKFLTCPEEGLSGQSIDRNTTTTDLIPD